MTNISLLLMINSLSTVETILLVIVAFLWLFGRSLPGLFPRVNPSVRVVKPQIRIIRDVAAQEAKGFNPVVAEKSSDCASQQI